MILICRGCGATKPAPTGDPTDLFPAEHCGQCPPWRCDTCGQSCSARALCPCWQSFDGMGIADVKAVFAADAEGRGGNEPLFDVLPRPADPTGDPT